MSRIEKALCVGILVCVILLSLTLPNLFRVLAKSQEQTAMVSNCSYKGWSSDSHGKIYECPNGLIYTVDASIRNAKGE